MTRTLKRDFLIPVENQQFSTEKCRVAWLRLGEGGKHRFALQYRNGHPAILSDYRTGYRVADLAGAAVARIAARGPFSAPVSLSDWRDLAQEKLDTLVKTFGEAQVRERLAAPPTLNR